MCENLLPSYTLPCTPAICELRYSDKKRAILVTVSGEKREIDLESGSIPEKLDQLFRETCRENPDIHQLQIYFPSPFLKVSF